MSESRTNEDFLNECWVGLTSWEQEVCNEFENEDATLSQKLLHETEAANKRLWVAFQNAAQCVALMYKGAADHQNSLWIPFQTAAGNVTSLYKESVECMRKCSEMGSHLGYQKRNKEVANWARRKRSIRRDELLAFLSGKTPPPRPNHFRSSPKTRLSLDRVSPRLPNNYQAHNQHGHEENLNTFREALGIPTPPPMSSPSLPSRRRGSVHTPELQSFICDEFARHKRPAPSSSPSHDVTMDSPQHKRFKLT